MKTNPNQKKLGVVELNYGTSIMENGQYTECMVAVGVLGHNGIDIKFHRRLALQERLEAPNTSIHKKWYYNMYQDMMDKNIGEWVIINLIREVDKKTIPTVVIQTLSGSNVTGTDRGFGFNVTGGKMHAMVMNQFAGKEMFLHMEEEAKAIKTVVKVQQKKVVKTFARFKVRDCRTVK